MFESVCDEGHLNIAKWLYNECLQLGNLMNLHSCRSGVSVFLLACKNGHYKVAKWLYEKNVNNKYHIDIGEDNYAILKYVCKYGPTNLAKWLCDVLLNGY